VEAAGGAEIRFVVEQTRPQNGKDESDVCR